VTEPRDASSVLTVGLVPGQFGPGEAVDEIWSEVVYGEN